VIVLEEKPDPRRLRNLYPSANKNTPEPLPCSPTIGKEE
jgi:hypothetical protein